MSLFLLEGLLLGILYIPFGALDWRVDTPHEMVRTPVVSLVGTKSGMILLAEHPCVILTLLWRQSFDC